MKTLTEMKLRENNNLKERVINLTKRPPCSAQNAAYYHRLKFLQPLATMVTYKFSSIAQFTGQNAA